METDLRHYEKLHKYDEPLSVESHYGVDRLLRRLREIHPELDPQREVREELALLIEAAMRDDAA